MAGGKRVAVIGASADRRKFGNKALRAFVHQGYDVVADPPARVGGRGATRVRVAARRARGGGHGHLLRAAGVGLQVIDTVAQKGFAEVWFNPGSESEALLARARDSSDSSRFSRAASWPSGSRPARY